MLFPFEKVKYNFAGCNFLRFCSEPLQGSLIITGRAVLSIWLELEQPDTSLTAYLICCGTDGKPYYVTEGHFNTKHRQVPQEELDPRLREPGLPSYSYTRE